MAPRVEIPDTPAELLREIDSSSAVFERERYLREDKMEEIMRKVLQVLERHNDEFLDEGELYVLTRTGARTGKKGFHGGLVRIGQREEEGIDPDDTVSTMEIEAWEVEADECERIAHLRYHDDPSDGVELDVVETISLAKVLTYLESSDLRTVAPQRYNELTGG